MNDILQNIKQNQCYIVKTGDDFLGEYPLDALNRMQKITGFGGSNGIAIFLQSKKIFLTDGRYTLQAKHELNDFEVLDMAQTSITQILKQNNITKVLLNTKIFSLAFVLQLIKNGIDILHNQQDEWIFNINYSNISKAFINFSESDEIAIFGISSKDKIQNICSILNENKVSKLLITDPHNIAYVLNKRGNDLANTPIKCCFLLISQQGSYEIFDNQNLYNFIKCTSSNDIVGVFECSYYIFNVLKQNVKDVKIIENFVEKWMTIKNKAELANIQKAAGIDSKILTSFFTKIQQDKQVQDKTELDIAKELYKLRQKCESFVCNSFDTISAFESNGAIIHYKPTQKTNKKLNTDGLLLIDSGGQFKFGTTDSTRVLLIGEAKQEWITNYTLVLKGHIALASCVFKKGTTGAMIDVLARQFLWQNGLDYKHGTGHGIGYFLSVHEGRGVGVSAGCNVVLEEGMVISNEPGFYKEHEYGIRLENMMQVIKSDHDGFLCFKMLTFIPFEEKLIDKNLLTEAENKWLTIYNQHIRHI